MSQAIHTERQLLKAYPADLTFYDLIRINKRNSVLLMLAMIVLIIALGVAIPTIFITVGQRRGLMQVDLAHAALLGGIAAGIAAGLACLWSWFGGAGAIASIASAQPLEKSQDPQLYNVIDELRLAAGIPMPQIYLIDDPSMNAFATGRDPGHSLVAITTGLRQKLDRDELAGVMAHELSHIRHYDIRFTMLMATLVGLIVMVADLSRAALQGTGRGFYYRSGSRDRDRGGGIGLLVALLLVVLLSVIALALAKLIQFAVSRQREYLADAGAVELTRYPRGLASALSKLATQNQPMQHANRAIAHLFIVNPFGEGEAWHNIDTVFRTHPPIEDRIARLLALDR